MKKFEEKKFNILPLKGISEKSIAEHLKLYSGYVKNANAVLEKIEEYGRDSEANAYALGELHRRFSFEFNGMRNHEYYFSHLEGGPTPFGPISAVRSEIEKTWGSLEVFLNRFKSIVLTTRGIGWAMLSYDQHTKRLIVHSV